MFVDDLDLYCWVESMPSAEDLYETIQAETKMWGDLLLALGDTLDQKSASGTCLTTNDVKVNGNPGN